MVKGQAIRFHERGALRDQAQPYIARARFVRAAQRLGFTPEEIARLLRFEEDGHCAEARELVEGKLATIRGRSADIERMVEAISRLVEQCEVRRGAVVSCPLIEALIAGERVPE